MNDQTITILTADRLMDAADVLRALSSAFSDMHAKDEDDARGNVMANMQCGLARLYVVELAKHLQNGVEIFEALRTVARGDTPLDSNWAAEFSRIVNDMNNPMKKN